MASSPISKSISVSHSVVSDSLQSYGLQLTRLLCPRDFPGKNTRVGFHSLLQGISPGKVSNPGLLHCRWILSHLSHQESPDPITSWQIDEEKVKAVTDFLFLGSKITVDSDCNHEIKRCLLLGSKAMTNLESISKSRDITLLTKVCIVKAMVFPIIMYRYESWIMKA